MISTRRTQYYVAVTLLVASFAVTSGTARADNLPVGGGCYVTGDVDGYPQYLDCTYTAQSGTQTVYVGTPNYWTTYVWREFLRHTTCWDPVTQAFVDCEVPVSEQVVLADGYGPFLLGDGTPRAPGLIEIHPVTGETVHVEMFGDCLPGLGTTCGKWGVVGTYE